MKVNSFGSVNRGGPPALRADSLFLTYRADTGAPVRALRGLSLEVAAGEFVAIAGPSGCGKTSLLNVLAGLRVPDHGRVLIGDADMTAGDDDARARLRREHVGIVFQHYRLLDTLTAVDNVVIAMRINGMANDAAESRARDLLALVALGARADAPIDALSGGQRQRVAIARALANDPAVLLADEPTGALDSDGQAEIAELFRRLHESGQTIVMVTHAMDLAATAGRIAVMRDGRLLEHGAGAR